MSAYIRSLSMNFMNGSGDGPGITSNGTGQNTSSPLQIFVQAKKSINDIFTDIEEYINETSAFVEGIPKDHPILKPEQVTGINHHVTKVKGIRDVLARDHMKVVFFGRTSNGKSTVINAMLRDKILPSGIGHTTSCFLQVEGTEQSGEEPYLTIPNVEGKQNVNSVGQLAHALCTEKLTESELVRIYWPRERCPLLRDDVVFVDSPGIDVSPNLDEWIDKHCLDADVFVLVANAESTLMLAEKNFFHKVSTRLSKPNIFILNNRWDASASEPDFLDQPVEVAQVRAQHQERTSDFLVNELKVNTREEVGERIFFVSAKEALFARLQESKGAPIQSGMLAEGFSSRYIEFQDFERKFEECISKSAVKTKFEQHSHRGKQMVSDTRQLLDKIQSTAASLREDKIMGRRELWDKIDFTDKQLQLLTHEMKEKIRHMVDDVEGKISKALSEEIRRLGVLVDEFNAPFHSDQLVLNIFKKELHNHVEAGLGSNLRARLSTALALNMENSQREMTERMANLLPADKKLLQLLPRRERFEVLYRLNCDNLCADFKEDIGFRFSYGITALANRWCGRQGTGWFPFLNAGPTETVHSGLGDGPMTPRENQFDWSLASRVAAATVTSQGTMGGLLVGGVLLKTVGWRVIAITGVIYGALYLYERLTWTNKAKEHEFKRQYVEHATRKLKLIVDLTSANCSHQVQQELSSTFARLCHLVDSSTSDMEMDMKALESEIGRLEEIGTSSKSLKNKANCLANELELFDSTFLKK